MSIKTPGLGLIALGILLLGAQLVLYLGYENIHTDTQGESHIVPVNRTSPLPGIFGMILLVSGVALSGKGRREMNDPRDGASVPGGDSNRR
jgi:hypothetical protein